MLMFYLENVGTVQNANRGLTGSLYDPCQPFRVGFNGRGKLALHIKMLMEINQLPSHIRFFSPPLTPLKLELDI